MKIEVNSLFAPADTTLTTPNGATVMITPPLTKDYWLARVAVSEQQAIVCFPKFGTIGIGFQHEDDWNTNLPYTTPAARIYEHIEHNKDAAPDTDNISDETCIAAIEALQTVIAAWRVQR